jgi:MFS family permease
MDYLLLTLCIGVFVTNANNSFISAFFPDLAIKNGVGEDLVGIIFSSEPVGVFFCSLVLGKIMNRKGFKVKCMFLGLLV